MNNMYICDVMYNDGSVAVFGPFIHAMSSDTGNAAAFGQALKDMPNSMIIKYSVRIVNQPGSVINFKNKA